MATYLLARCLCTLLIFYFSTTKCYALESSSSLQFQVAVPISSASLPQFSQSNIETKESSVRSNEEKLETSRVADEKETKETYASTKTWNILKSSSSIIFSPFWNPVKTPLLIEPSAINIHSSLVTSSKSHSLLSVATNSFWDRTVESTIGYTISESITLRNLAANGYSKVRLSNGKSSSVATESTLTYKTLTTQWYYENTSNQVLNNQNMKTQTSLPQLSMTLLTSQNNNFSYSLQGEGTTSYSETEWKSWSASSTSSFKKEVGLEMQTLPTSQLSYAQVNSIGISNATFLSTAFAVLLSLTTIKTSLSSSSNLRTHQSPTLLPTNIQASIPWSTVVIRESRSTTTSAPSLHTSKLSLNRLASSHLKNDPSPTLTATNFQESTQVSDTLNTTPKSTKTSSVTLQTSRLSFDRLSSSIIENAVSPTLSSISIKSKTSWPTAMNMASMSITTSTIRSSSLSLTSILATTSKLATISSQSIQTSRSSTNTLSAESEIKIEDKSSILISDSRLLPSIVTSMQTFVRKTIPSKSSSTKTFVLPTISNVYSSLPVHSSSSIAPQYSFINLSLASRSVAVTPQVSLSLLTTILPPNTPQTISSSSSIASSSYFSTQYQQATTSPSIYSPNFSSSMSSKISDDVSEYLSTIIDMSSSSMNIFSSYQALPTRSFHLTTAKRSHLPPTLQANSSAVIQWLASINSSITSTITSTKVQVTDTMNQLSVRITSTQRLSEENTEAILTKNEISASDVKPTDAFSLRAFPSSTPQPLTSTEKVMQISMLSMISNNYKSTIETKLNIQPSSSIVSMDGEKTFSINSQLHLTASTPTNQLITTFGSLVRTTISDDFTTDNVESSTKVRHIEARISHLNAIVEKLTTTTNLQVLSTMSTVSKSNIYSNITKHIADTVLSSPTSRQMINNTIQKNNSSVQLVKPTTSSSLSLSSLHATHKINTIITERRILSSDFLEATATELFLASSRINILPTYTELSSTIVIAPGETKSQQLISDNNKIEILTSQHTIPTKSGIHFTPNSSHKSSPSFVSNSSPVVLTTGDELKTSSIQLSTVNDLDSTAISHGAMPTGSYVLPTSNILWATASDLTASDSKISSLTSSKSDGSLTVSTQQLLKVKSTFQSSMSSSRKATIRNSLTAVEASSNLYTTDELYHPKSSRQLLTSYRSSLSSNQKVTSSTELLVIPTNSSILTQSKTTTPRSSQSVGGPDLITSRKLVASNMLPSLSNSYKVSATSFGEKSSVLRMITASKMSAILSRDLLSSSQHLITGTIQPATSNDIDKTTFRELKTSTMTQILNSRPMTTLSAQVGYSDFQSSISTYSREMNWSEPSITNLLPASTLNQQVTNLAVSASTKEFTRTPRVTTTHANEITAASSRVQSINSYVLPTNTHVMSTSESVLITSEIDPSKGFDLQLITTEIIPGTTEVLPVNLRLSSSRNSLPTSSKALPTTSNKKLTITQTDLTTTKAILTSESIQATSEKAIITSSDARSKTTQSIPTTTQLLPPTTQVLLPNESVLATSQNGFESKSTITHPILTSTQVINSQAMTTSERVLTKNDISIATSSKLQKITTQQISTITQVVITSEPELTTNQKVLTTTTSEVQPTSTHQVLTTISIIPTYETPTDKTVLTKNRQESLRTSFKVQPTSTLESPTTLATLVNITVAPTVESSPTTIQETLTTSFKVQPTSAQGSLSSTTVAPTRKSLFTTTQETLTTSFKVQPSATEELLKTTETIEATTQDVTTSLEIQLATTKQVKSTTVKGIPQSKLTRSTSEIFTATQLLPTSKPVITIHQKTTTSSKVQPSITREISTSKLILRTSQKASQLRFSTMQGAKTTAQVVQTSGKILTRSINTLTTSLEVKPTTTQDIAKTTKRITNTVRALSTSDLELATSQIALATSFKVKLTTTKRITTTTEVLTTSQKASTTSSEVQSTITQEISSSKPVLSTSQKTLASSQLELPTTQVTKASNTVSAYEQIITTSQEALTTNFQVRSTTQDIARTTKKISTNTEVLTASQKALTTRPKTQPTTTQVITRTATGITANTKVIPSEIVLTTSQKALTTSSEVITQKILTSKRALLSSQETLTSSQLELSTTQITKATTQVVPTSKQILATSFEVKLSTTQEISKTKKILTTTMVITGEPEITSSQNVLVTSIEVQPTVTQDIPKTTEKLPTTTGVILTSESVLTTSEEALSISSEVKPTTTQEITKTTNEIITTTKVLQTSESLVTTSDKTLTTSVGVEPTTPGDISKNTKSIITTEVLPTSEQILTTSLKALTTSYEVKPTTTKDIARTTEGLPITIEVMPTGHQIIATSEKILSTSLTTKLSSASVLTTSQKALTASFEVPPTTSQEIQTTNQVLSTSEITLTKSSKKLPITNQEISTSKNETPRTTKVLPTKEPVLTTNKKVSTTSLQPEITESSSLVKVIASVTAQAEKKTETSSVHVLKSSSEVTVAASPTPSKEGPVTTTTIRTNYYDPWAKWSPCSATCDLAVRARRRFCHGVCEGDDSQEEICDVPPCPIDGNWGNWTEYGACNQTCGYGAQERIRLCDNPPAQYGGLECPGTASDVILGCNPNPCPIHGGLSQWSEWSVCLRPCSYENTLSSTSRRERACDNPKPQYRGRPCQEPLINYRICNTPKCEALDFRYEIRFPDEIWYYTMIYTYTDEAVDLFQRITGQIAGIYNSTNYIKDFISHGFRKGSVIADFTITYFYVHYDQIVTFVDNMYKTQTLGNMNITHLQYNSTTIKCPPPKNVKVVKIDAFNMNITFERDSCETGYENKSYAIYLFYKEVPFGMNNQEITVESNETAWSVDGCELYKRWIPLRNLKAATTYSAYLLVSATNGNAAPGKNFIIKTPIGPPSRKPDNVTATTSSPNEIYVEWLPVPLETWNGQSLGYIIRYRTQENNDVILERRTISTSLTLEELIPYTSYVIEVTAYNEAGESPLEFAVERTQEGVPSIAVPNVVIDDMQDINWWSISWSPLPRDTHNGILLGYKLVYYMTHQSGLELIGELQKFEYIFDVYTVYFKATNLENFAVYDVSVTGFTIAGDGPVIEHQARTCNCMKNLYANWIISQPYTYLPKKEELTGIFVDILNDVILEACGSCAAYEKSEIHYFISRTGDENQKISEFELKQSISPFVDVSFPIYGRKERKKISPGALFTQLIPSPGCAIIVRDEGANPDNVVKMILGVLNVWPLLLVSYAIATVFGILVWFADQFANPEEFSLGDSLRGPLVGFWFAFVTMTTVGYGDITPRSVVARIISMVWFLVGLVLNGIIIGFVATALTSFGLPEEIKLYNTKTAALNNSFEYRYAVLRNARVDMSKQYTNIPSMLNALQNNIVDAVLVDTYSMTSYKDVLKAKFLKVRALVKTDSGYGFVLSGLSQAIQPSVESLLSGKESLVGEFISSLEDKVPNLDLPQNGEATKDLFSGNNPAFISSVSWMGAMILAGAIIGIALDIRKKVHSKVRVQPEEIPAEEQYKHLSEGIEELLDYTNECREKVHEVFETKENICIQELVTLVKLKKRHGNPVLNLKQRFKRINRRKRHSKTTSIKTISTTLSSSSSTV